MPLHDHRWHQVHIVTAKLTLSLSLPRQYTKVNQFVKSLDMRMEEKEEQRKIAGVKERIESYNAVTVHTSHVNDQVQQVNNKSLTVEREA